MPITQLILKPTFPLNKTEISERSRKVKLSHPLTWISFGGGAILPFLVTSNLPAAIFGAFIGLGIAGVAMSAFWQGRHARIEAQVVEEMISESNAEQDRKLSKIVAQYRSRGLHQYAAALGKFLLLKKGIEKRLHPDGKVTQTSEQIERLVDTLCASVCREFDKVSLLDTRLGDVLISGNTKALEKLQSERTQVLESIMTAYATLYQSLESVVVYDNSGELVPEIKTGQPQQETNLEDTVESLKAEIEMARRIRDRLSIPEADENDADFEVFDQGSER